MKRGFLILFFLLAIPIAYATISIDGPQKQTFNLGDEISVSGYVLRDTSFSGFFKLSLICNNNRIELPLTSLSLTAGERKLFPSQLSIPKIIANNIEGDCFIEASLLSGADILELNTSSNFAIAKSLQGIFKIDKSRLQAGDSFTLTGEITKLDGKPTDGSMELYFESNTTRFLVDIISIKEGKFEYTYKASPLPSNTYYLNSLVKDIFGNIQLFDNVASFDLISDLSILAKLEKSTIKPGENIKIFGEVKNIFQNPINNGVIKILFDDNSYKADIKDGNFEKTIETDKKIRSGRHLIKLTAEDNLGNIGFSELNINIQPTLEGLSLELNKDIFNPNEIVAINPLLYDQAGSLVTEDISIEITDPDKKTIFSEVTKTNNKVSYGLSQFTNPGVYKVLISVKDLKKESQFEVNEVIDADVLLDNQTLLIYNLGNVLYDKPVKVDLGEYKIVKRASILPNQTELIYLFEEFPSGVYDIIVTYSDKKKTFEDVTILGKPKKSFNTVYIILTIALFLLLGYLFFIKRKKVPKIKEHKKKEVKKEVYIKPKEYKEERKLKYKFGKASEEDLKQWKKRIVEEIKKTEDKKKGETNLFGMFK